MESAGSATNVCGVCVASHHKTEGSATNPNAQITHKGGPRAWAEGPQAMPMRASGPDAAP
jgi:hypothetical protein